MESFSADVLIQFADSNNPVLFVFRVRSTSLWIWGPRRRAHPSSADKTWGEPDDQEDAEEVPPLLHPQVRRQGLRVCTVVFHWKNKHPTLELRHGVCVFLKQGLLGSMMEVMIVYWATSVTSFCFLGWTGFTGSLHYSFGNVDLNDLN